MLSFKEFLEEEKVRKGLHQAKVGDDIHIGAQGHRHKRPSKVTKITKDNKVVDDNGNVYHRDGQIHRGMGRAKNQREPQMFPKRMGKVSAKLVSQKEHDHEHKQIRIRHIKHQIEKEHPDTIEKIHQLLSVKNANTKGKSRFEK